MNKPLRFPSLVISKEDFEEKYDVTLTDMEWKLLSSHTNNSWGEHLEELRLMIFRHIRIGMKEIGYKPSLTGKSIKFEKVKKTNGFY